MLEIYIAGGYLAILIYALLLNNDAFREYTEYIIKTLKIKKLHPYSIMQLFGIILLSISWCGVILVGLLLLDYFMNY